MGYVKFKELTKYFDFKDETNPFDLPDYTKEYIDKSERILMGYKNTRDYVVFTDKKMLLFDRDTFGLYYKKIHIIPYISISTSAINFKPSKVEILLSLDSGYQLHINFIDMDHNRKETIKKVYLTMMKSKIN